MNKELLKLKKRLDSTQQEHSVDSDGRVTVCIKVTEDDGFLSPYSTDQSIDIAPDVAEFIESSVENVDKDKRIRLVIYGNTITDEEKTAYTNAIHSHYESRYRREREQTIKHNRLALIMALVAVVALTVMILLDSFGVINAVTSEIIDIFAWVFMWEAVYIFFLQRPAHKAKQLRCLQLADAAVEYRNEGSVEQTEQE